MGRVLGPLLAGLLLGAVLGGIAIFLFFGATPAPILPDGATATAKEREPATGGSGGPTPIAVIGAVDAARTETKGDLAAVPKGVESAVLELVKHAPAPTTERGTGVIEGRVLEQGGAPLAGVLVRATRQSDRAPTKSERGNNAPPIRSLEQRVRDAVAEHYRQQADLREVTTDGDGRYRIDGLRDGDFALQAWTAGYVVRITGGGRGTVHPDAKQDFTAVPVVRVKIAVELPDGTAAAEAALVLKTSGARQSNQTEGWKAESPEICFEPGSYEVKASLGDPDQGPPWPEVLTSDSVRLNVVAGQSVGLQTFKLHGSPGVRGRVTFSDDVPNGRAPVRLMKLQPGQEPDLDKLASAEQNRSGRGDLTYVFRDLAPGRYVVGASRTNGGRILAHAVVEVRDAMAVQDLLLPPLDAQKCLLVTVTGPDHQPVGEASFSFTIEKEGNSNGQGTFAARRGAGKWLVSYEASDKGEQYHLDEPWPGGINVTLNANCAEFGNKSVPVRAGQRSAEIQFGTPGKLLVTVAGYVGSGFEGRCSLNVNHPRDDNDEWGGNFGYWGGFNRGDGVASDGKQTFGPLDPGRWRVILSVRASEGREWESHAVAFQDVDIAPGENQATVAIPALYALTVQVPGSANGSVQLARTDASNRFGMGQRQLDSDGKTTFDGLAAGDYDLTAWGGDGNSGSMKVRVPTSGIVTFAPQPQNALRVNLWDENGKLAKAGFKNQDLIVAVDGSEFANRKEMRGLVIGAAAKTELVLRVARGGSTLDLKLAPRDLLDEESLGGQLEPAAR